MKIPAFWALAILALSSSFARAESILLDEHKVKELSQSANPSIYQIESSELSAKRLEAGFRERFQTDFVSQVSYQDSKEKAIATFIPTFGPSTNLSVGVERPFMFGANGNVSFFTSQQSTIDNVIDRATRTGIRLGFAFDVWKNLFGRLNKAQLSHFESQTEKATIQSEIDRKVFELNLRKIYWSMVANREQMKVSQKLFEAAQKQLRQAKKRLRDSVADRGEVARYEAQVAARRVNLSGLSYQWHLLAQSLQTQLPTLLNKNISLAPYDVQDSVTDVLNCTLKN